MERFIDIICIAGVALFVPLAILSVIAFTFTGVLLLSTHPELLN
jgi:hypothetical protein